MGNPRGVKRDFIELKRRRSSAVELFCEGLNNVEIGCRLNVPNQTVSRWRKQYKTGGKAVLEKIGRAGRQPLLNAAQLSQLHEILRRSPEFYGFKSSRWTCARVAHAIEKEFAVGYHPGHVWKILRGKLAIARRPAVSSTGRQGSNHGSSTKAD